MKENYITKYLKVKLYPFYNYKSAMKHLVSAVHKLNYFKILTIILDIDNFNCFPLLCFVFSVYGIFQHFSVNTPYKPEIIY